MRKRVLATIAALAAAALVLTGCSTRAPSDSVILYYQAGVGDNKAFQECIEPGHAGPGEADNEIFELPTSLRTWNIRTSGGDTDKPINSGTKPKGTQPGPEVAVWTTTDFFLNTDCTGGKNSPIVQFWEQTGRSAKLSADGEDGFNVANWKHILNNTLVPSQEKALHALTRGYDADDLDNNIGGIWTQIERQMAPAFQAELRAKVGGDYFCGTGYQRGKEVEWTEWVPDGVDDKGLPKVREETRRGKCPPVRISIIDMNLADTGIVAARSKVFEAEQNAKAALIAAQSQVDVAAKLAQAGKDPGYVRLREMEVQLQLAQLQLEAAKACASHQDCTLVIGADGVNVGKK